MQQIRLFKGVESELGALESAVNDWIRQSGARIIQITGNIAPQSINPRSGSEGLTQSSFSPSDVILIILYEAAG